MQRRQIALEEATPRQREIVSQLIELARPPGTVWRIVLGDGAWDTRILTRDQSGLWLTRPIDPILSEDSAAFDQFRLLLNWACHLSPEYRSGEANGRLWYCRPFASTVLADREPPSSREELLSLFRRIAETVEQYHASSRVHGHVSLANIVIRDNSTITLVDPGFAIFCPSARVGRSSLAPEIGGDSPVSAAADIFTLGKVGRKLAGTLGLHRELNSLFEVMTSMDVSRRPSIHWVLAVLRDLQDGRPLSTDRNETIRSGGRGSAVLRPTPKATPSEPQITHNSSQREGQLPQSPNEPPPLITNHQEAEPVPASSIEYPSRNERRASSWVAISLLFAFVALASAGRFFWGQKQEAPPFDGYWTSGHPTSMRIVAEAAIREHNLDAQIAILDAARRGFTHGSIHAELLKVALDPRWEAELSDDDREVILTLAVGSLLSGREPVTISDSTHPGVLFGILARSPIEAPAEELQLFPPSRLAELPAPIGPTFKGLQALGLRSIEEIEAKAAAHLLANDLRPPVLAAYLSPYRDEGRLLAKLDIIKDALQANNQLCIEVLGALVPQSELIRSFMSWFDQDELDTWKEVQPPARFLISLGLVGEQLSYDQLVDLLAFRRLGIRETAGRRLLSNPSFSAIHEVLPVLVASQNSLSRIQVLSLAGALQTTGRDQLLLVHGWLKTQPPPLIVAQLLVARDGKTSTDGFNLEAARYLLQSRTTNLPREILVDLSTHSESMARAYAYGILKPSNPEDRRILEAALSAETNPRLKKQLVGTLR